MGYYNLISHIRKLEIMNKQLKELIEEIAREETANRYSYNIAYHTRRIADTLEAILQLIKDDLKRNKK